jgi:hypothetical protein
MKTGVVQPVSEIASALQDSQVFLHVDAGQGFGKDLEPLRNPRIDHLEHTKQALTHKKSVNPHPLCKSPEPRITTRDSSTRKLADQFSALAKMGLGLYTIFCDIGILFSN